MYKLKSVAAALVATLVLQTAAPMASAASMVTNNDVNVVTTMQQRSMDTDSQTGGIAVELDLILPIDYSDGIKVKGVLKGSNGTSYNIEFHYERLDNKLYGTAMNCEPGDYTLIITGDGYQQFEQVVNVKAQYISKLVIHNSHEFDELLTDSKRTGVIGYGDVNGDGNINEEDMTSIMDAIANNSAQAEYDLNKDGKVDIADAGFISYNLNGNNIESSIVSILSTDHVEKIETTGIVTGDINGILSDIGVVQLEPEKDEEISENNPIVIDLDVNSNGAKTEGITIVPPSNLDNAITDGIVTVEDEENNIYEVLIGNGAITEKDTKGVTAYAFSTAATVMVEPDGSIVINLNGQVAIKKVSIKVTGTNSKNLAEIAKVEFLNNMEDRIPAPSMDIPQNVVGTPGNKEFTVAWNKANNVTGYEVEITSEGKTQVIRTGTNRITVKQFMNNKIKNGTTFVVRVQSTNGDWRSGYSSSIEVIPETTKVPDAPENISIVGGYKLLRISWKDMEDTDSYNLYYRKKGSSDKYEEIIGITKNSYELMDLEVNTTYELYLQGVNEIGIGDRSAISIGATTEFDYAKTSNYKLINVPEESGKTAHIKSVSYPAGKASNDFAVVDNDYGTDWILNSWTAGGYSGKLVGPIVEFDDYYKMDRFTIIESSQQTYDYFYSKVRYWDENGKEQIISGRHAKKKDSAGKIYYEFSLQTPITTNKIQVNFSNYLAYGDGKISIAEMKFYNYDSLESDIYNLFEDDTHISLKPEVTADDISKLEVRLNTPDPVSGEFHYKKGILEIELANAKAILNQEALRSPIKIDTTVTKAKDGHLGFQSGLNAWQPLGITAYEGEELVIYVGRDGAKVGSNSNLKLVATQFHAESGKWMKEVVSNLKVGKNEVTIPKISSMAVEHGGALYVEFTGNNDQLNMNVRVSGGSDVPVLDISNLSSESEKKKAIKTYIETLTAYVEKLEETHNSNHIGNAATDYKYDNKNCILNVTDIVLDKMMYSVSAEQILKGILNKTGSNNIDQQVETVYQALSAMDQMTELFYQHKGLVEYPTDAQEYAAFVKTYGEKNKMPSSRLNIRYHRMFAGAFMYAGGLHVGIEWGSVSGLMAGKPVISKDGKYESGQLFGWGIAHEIGHIINQSDYAIAEITNNYFSVLAQAKETNNSVRFSYDEVYKKVTSGTIGRADNVFTSLGMYWQLHLAYDNGYNYKTYQTYEEQLNHLLFARVDSYARNNSLAPKFADGKEFTLKDAKDTDNKLMRLVTAATKKNLLDFFISWGMIPDETTINYASQFEKETRKIQYITDEARDYRISNRNQEEEIANVTKNAAVKATIHNPANSKQVTIGLSSTGMQENSLLGYEIIRNGETVAFVDGSETEYIDVVNFNNKVANYKIVAYDKFLNTTKEVKLDPIKIKHDGSINKDKWSITTNMTSENDTPAEDDACGVNPIKAIIDTIDNDYSNTYTGKVKSGNAEVVIHLGEVTQIIGLKYTKGLENAIKDYEILVSKDAANWTSIKTGTFSSESSQETIYFTKENSELGTSIDIQEVSYIKVIAKGKNTISINELDIIGQPDDNVELLQNGIGKLKEDLVVDEGNHVVIPAGSIVVTGDYSGHPAFNVVLLINADTGEVIEGSQYIFAEDPKDAELGAVSSGTWIYNMEPDENGQLPTLPKNIKAELYRVDNAVTLEGQRFVSDTLSVEVPEKLGDITINKR